MVPQLAEQIAAVIAGGVTAGIEVTEEEMMLPPHYPKALRELEKRVPGISAIHRCIHQPTEKGGKCFLEVMTIRSLARRLPLLKTYADSLKHKQVCCLIPASQSSYRRNSPQADTV